jgi:prepilin-type N-terminal cleavage/methylation domain-containing protein
MFTNEKRAFTLLELLVTIAVLAILAALLLPALSMGRQRAQSAQCLNNLRQLGVAWSAYADDFRDYTPSPKTETDGRVIWFAGYEDYLGNNPNDLNPGNPFNWNVTNVYNNCLWNYAKNAAIYRCPADQRQCVVSSASFPVLRSLSMNGAFCSSSNLNRFLNSSGGNFHFFSKKADISQPANTFVFVEESPAGINDDLFAVDCGSTLTAGDEKIVDFPAVFHGGHSTAFAFADSHVEMHRWLGTTILSCPRPPMPLAEYPAGNSQADVDWLVQNTSSQ